MESKTKTKTNKRTKTKTSGLKKKLCVVCGGDASRPGDGVATWVFDGSRSRLCRSCFDSKQEAFHRRRRTTFAEVIVWAAGRAREAAETPGGPAQLAGFYRGVRAAAALAAEYPTTHPYRLDDCIEGKLNVPGARARPRRRG